MKVHSVLITRKFGNDLKSHIELVTSDFDKAVMVGKEIAKQRDEYSYSVETWNV